MATKKLLVNLLEFYLRSRQKLTRTIEGNPIWGDQTTHLIHIYYGKFKGFPLNSALFGFGFMVISGPHVFLGKHLKEGLEFVTFWWFLMDLMALWDENQPSFKKPFGEIYVWVTFSISHCDNIRCMNGVKVIKGLP